MSAAVYVLKARMDPAYLVSNGALPLRKEFRCQQSPVPFSALLCAYALLPLPTPSLSILHRDTHTDSAAVRVVGLSQVSASGLFLGGLMGGLGTFVLMWTMAYDVVHIYG